MRLFTAIDLPREQRNFLHRLTKELSGIRVTPQAQLHLTLNFIGEVNAMHFRKLCEECMAVTTTPFSIQLQGIGTFPPKGPPRILWVGVPPCLPLLQLQQLLKKKLLTTGIRQEERKFRPHITLARIKHCSQKDLSTFCKAHAELTFPPFTVTTYHLYSSRLSRAGAAHTLEQSFELQKDTKN